MIYKRNLIKKKIKELKGPRERNEELFDPEESFNPVELEQAFDGVYSSYKIIIIILYYTSRAYKRKKKKQSYLQ